MKHSKKLTRKQKIFLKSKGYEVNCYLVIKDTNENLFILNKITGETEEVPK